MWPLWYWCWRCRVLFATAIWHYYYWYSGILTVALRVSWLVLCLSTKTRLESTWFFNRRLVHLVYPGSLQIIGIHECKCSAFALDFHCRAHQIQEEYTCSWTLVWAHAHCMSCNKDSDMMTDLHAGLKSTSIDPHIVTGNHKILCACTLQYEAANTVAGTGPHAGSILVTNSTSYFIS